MADRRYVHCTCGPDGEKVDHLVSRALCVFETRPGCPSCPNSQFEVLFQLRIGDQVVACPRWESDRDMEARKDPIGYVPTARAVCLGDKPYLFCLQCPNSKPDEAPQFSEKWFELEERRKRIERELDEELNE